MTAPLRNTTTTAGLELDQRRCSSFYFLVSLCFLLPSLLCKLCLTLANSSFSKRFAMRRLRRLYTTVNVSESSIDESSGCQTPRGEKAILYITMCSGKQPQSRSLSDGRLSAHVHSFLKTGPFFLSTVSF